MKIEAASDFMLEAVIAVKGGGLRGYCSCV